MMCTDAPFEKRVRELRPGAVALHKADIGVVFIRDLHTCEAIGAGKSSEAAWADAFRRITL